MLVGPGGWKFSAVRGSLGTAYGAPARPLEQNVRTNQLETPWGINSRGSYIYIYIIKSSKSVW